MKNVFPKKDIVDTLEDEIQYCHKLINVIENNELIAAFHKARKI